MLPQMILNELSLQPADDLNEARLRMQGLVDTMAKATRMGVDRVLRTSDAFHSVLVGDGYTVAHWLRDSAVDRERRRWLRLLTTKSPFLTELGDSARENDVLSSDFLLRQLQCVGLGYAYLLDGLAVSLLSAAAWDTSSLDVRHLTMDDGGRLHGDDVPVRHASRPAHVDAHARWIGHCIGADVRDGADLMNRASDLLPSLQFCEPARDQIGRLRSGPLLTQVVRRLTELNAFCQGWTRGPFDPGAFPGNVTPESPATLRQFGRDRTFRCPDGRERVFSWHVRLTPYAWRVYFDPEVGPGTLLVGYVGAHLPTAMHPR